MLCSDSSEITQEILCINLNGSPSTWEGKGLWKELKMDRWSSPYLVLSQIMFVLLKLFLEPFKIFHHKVLPGELIVVGEMVDDL